MQWYQVLARGIGITLSKLGVADVSASQIIESFSAQGRCLTGEKPHRLYKDILRIGFITAFAELGLTPGEDEIKRVASSPMKKGPHPEVPAALLRLREHYKLAIFRRPHN